MDEPGRGPVTLREIGAEFRAEYLQWDRGLPGTLWAASVRPAAVARAYLARDRTWVRPLRYLLLSIVASVGVAWVVYGNLGPSRTLAAGAAAADAPFLLEHAAPLTLLVLPLVALVLRAAFHGLGMRYVDALVLLGYTQAQVNWFGTVGPPLLLAGAPQPVLVGLSAAIALWLLWAWAGFARGPAWRRWLAALASLVLGQALNGAVVWAALSLWRGAQA